VAATILVAKPMARMTSEIAKDHGIGKDGVAFN
jgi:hypothetical protein